MTFILVLLIHRLRKAKQTLNSSSIFTHSKAQKHNSNPGSTKNLQLLHAPGSMSRKGEKSEKARRRKNEEEKEQS